jgi:hypothetical protein
LPTNFIFKSSSSKRPEEVTAPWRWICGGRYGKIQAMRTAAAAA